MGVNAIFGSLALNTDDYVKNQGSFTTYYAGYGFFGQLATLTTDEMYAVKLVQATTLHVTGSPTPLPKTVSFAVGWTWLPNPHQSETALSDGAPSFSYTGGDQLKSQSQFSEYYEGYGWFGSLSVLQPGMGYKVKAASGGVATFVE